MKFVAGAPAAVIGKTLLVADLHLGIEFELRKKGVSIGLQYERVAKQLNALLKKTKASELVVLGDAKHDVFGLEQKEKRMMASFHGLLDCESVTVIKGNHDSQLNELKGFNVKPASGVRLDFKGVSFGLCHGHAWPKRELLECDWLLTAHQHPCLQFKDLGYWTVACWLVGNMKTNKKHGTRKEQKIVVFPAFNALSGGVAANKEELLGPLFKNRLVNLKELKAFSLEGMFLGKIRQLKKA